MVLVPCNQIHTLGMTYPIDVCYVGAEGRVLRVLHALAPWRMTWPCRGAYWTVELAPGGLFDTTEGDEIQIEIVPGDPSRTDPAINGP